VESEISKLQASLDQVTSLLTKGHNDDDSPSATLTKSKSRQMPNLGKLQHNNDEKGVSELASLVQAVHADAEIESGAHERLLACITTLCQQMARIEEQFGTSNNVHSNTVDLSEEW